MTECNGESRPSDKGGGGGGVGVGAGPKTFFGPSGLSLVKNNGGGGGGALPLDPALEWSRNSCNRGTQRGYSSKPLNIALLNVF